MKYISVIALIAFSAILIYLYIFRKKHTRERYAFWATLSLFSFAGIVLVHIYTDNSLIKIAMSIANDFFNQNIPIPETSWSDKLFSIMIFGALGMFVYSIHRNWDGAKSKNELDWGTQTFLKNAYAGLPIKKIETADENKISLNHAMQPYFDVSFDWHSDVVNMLKIISSKYYINKNKDWYSEEQIFIGRFAQQNIAIFCTLEEPTKEEIEYKINFVKEHIGGELSRLIVAVQNENKPKDEKRVGETLIQYRYKNELLESLVDFSDYFYYIKQAYEHKEISDGDSLTIKDVYVSSSGEIKKEKENNEAIESVESYILDWTKEKSSKHISLLGEYGQGKSVLSLKLAYEMIMQDYERIPIIIELRGKSPRNESIESIVSAWAGNFDIKPSGVMRLLKEGRLLIILEGFDEMDMIGDAHRRMEHFNRLWEFARYEKSKVLITGRPNLFLDNHEMEDYLNAYENKSKLFYSEAIHLQPFNSEQIEEALREVDSSVKREMIDLLQAKTNKSFEDLISRPSTLYQASMIWHELDKSSINSATVIENFLNHAYRRQEEKLRNIGKTGVEALLTTNERKYFMLGIAVGMIQKNGYTNQINHTDLNKLVQNLYQNIPEEVSSDYSLHKPLHQRMKDNREAMDSISNDIRTSVVLVRDLTQHDSFKFAHKSFLEYLSARYFVEYRYRENKSKFLDKIYKLYIHGIEKSFNIRGGSSEFSDETIGFIVDLIKIDSPREIKCKDILNFLTPLSILISKNILNRIPLRVYTFIRFFSFPFSDILHFDYDSRRYMNLREKEQYYRIRAGIRVRLVLIAVLVTILGLLFSLKEISSKYDIVGDILSIVFIFLVLFSIFLSKIKKHIKIYNRACKKISEDNLIVEFYKD